MKKKASKPKSSGKMHESCANLPKLTKTKSVAVHKGSASKGK